MFKVKFIEIRESDGEVFEDVREFSSRDEWVKVMKDEYGSGGEFGEGWIGDDYFEYMDEDLSVSYCLI